LAAVAVEQVLTTTQLVAQTEPTVRHLDTPLWVVAEVVLVVLVLSQATVVVRAVVLESQTLFQAVAVAEPQVKVMMVVLLLTVAETQVLLLVVVVKVLLVLVVLVLETALVVVVHQTLWVAERMLLVVRVVRVGQLLQHTVAVAVDKM